MTYQEQYDRAEKEKKTENITPTFIKFEKAGMFIIGQFVDTMEVESLQTGGKYEQYIFDTDTGRIKFHMGANADKEIGALMKKGAVYFVRFDGKEDISKNQTVNKWTVKLVDDTNAEKLLTKEEPF